MTQPWTIERIWAGETVAILGNGPAMTEALASRARAQGWKTIAVNRAVKFAPDADLFVALDPHHPFWADADDFAGIKVSGVDSDDPLLADARYAGMFYETVQIAPGHTIEIRNNFLAAMRIAARLGAAKILLLGVDEAAYDQAHAHTGFYGFAEGLAQLTAALSLEGIAVERVEDL
ncbi:MAG: hypothetical protein ABI790_02340 [Betaproteobacteria bacterium]